QQAVFDERAGVEEHVEPLADRRLAQRPLAFDQLRAAHGIGPLLPPLQVLDERLPVMKLVAHCSLLPPARPRPPPPGGRRPLSNIGAPFPAGIPPFGQIIAPSR